MNEIVRTRALLLRAYPDAASTLDGPTKGGHWLLEVKRGETAIVVVWRDGGALAVAIEHDRDREPALYETRLSVEEVIRLAVDSVAAFDRKWAGSEELKAPPEKKGGQP